MLDRDLINNLLVQVELLANDLAQADLDNIESDKIPEHPRLVNRQDAHLSQHGRYLGYTMQMAITGVISVADIIIGDVDPTAPNNPKRLFELLTVHGWVPQELLPQMRDMAALHNVLVHNAGGPVHRSNYRRSVERSPASLRDFVRAIRSKLLQ